MEEEVVDRDQIRHDFLRKQRDHARAVLQRLEAEIADEDLKQSPFKSVLDAEVAADRAERLDNQGWKMCPHPQIGKPPHCGDPACEYSHSHPVGPTPVEPSTEDEHFEELLTWWRTESELDAQKTIPKAIEYGSIDLNIIGYALGECIPALQAQRREGSTEAAEMGIAFYLLGKIARMVSAYSEGQRPSDDTWMDVTVYSMMGRRVRDRGSWG